VLERFVKKEKLNVTGMEKELRQNVIKKSVQMQNLENATRDKDVVIKRENIVDGQEKKVATGMCKSDRLCASRRVGKCHLRKRCCDLNGKKCSWVGKAYKTGSCGKSICSMRTVAKCSLRKRCCTQVKTVKGYKSSCKWFGRRIKMANCKKSVQYKKSRQMSLSKEMLQRKKMQIYWKKNKKKMH